MLDVTVRDLGARGDGLADHPSRNTPLYIPFAAPGDRLRVRTGRARGEGRAVEIETILVPGTGRTAPHCRHFTHCGGCALQHISPIETAEFKRRILVESLDRRGLRGDIVATTISVPPGTRRRVELAADGGRRPRLGLHHPRGRRIVDLEECPVATDAIAASIAPLRELLGSARPFPRRGDIRITETDSGLDLLLLPGRAPPPGARVRQHLAEFAETHDIARISWWRGDGGEPLIFLRQPVLQLTGATVALPEGYFLQPSREGAAILAEAACRGVGPAKRIADLYAGCGALSFALARLGQVKAFEGDPHMVAAVKKAASGQPVDAMERDFARAPLTAEELRPFDAVVFDPPRAGAQAQARALANSAVGRIVAISCNPATLARDLRHLVDGGYRVESVTPIDQFVWSAEIEAVAVLSRD